MKLLAQTTFPIYVTQTKKGYLRLKIQAGGCGFHGIPQCIGRPNGDENGGAIDSVRDEPISCGQTQHRPSRRLVWAVLVLSVPASVFQTSLPPPLLKMKNIPIEWFYSDLLGIAYTFTGMIKRIIIIIIHFVFSSCVATVLCII